jgi:hypothetical protein
MGSKNQPGKFDCYSKAEPDEPMFVLLGRDPAAGVLVQFWVELRRSAGDDNEDQLDEALRCAEAMTQWAIDHGKREQVNRMLDALSRAAVR